MPTGWAIDRWLAFLITLIAVAWTSDLPRVLFNQPLLVQEFSLVVLGLCIALTFLTRSRSGTPKATIDLLSVAIGILAIGTALYAAGRYRVMSEALYYHPLESGIVALILFPLVIESLRRLVGWPLVIIVLLFSAYGLVGDLVPAPLTARPWAPADLATHLVWDTTAMVGLPLSIGTTVVIPFIVFGVVLNRAGGGEFFSDLAIATMGGLRGGAAKIAIVASALFGTISGSAVSNVASTGVISIPLMKRSGFPARLAAATECVASTGGQFMPPVMGAAAFLMAEISQTPYQAIALAAILPALFFFVAVFLQSDSDAVRLNIAAIPPEQRKQTRQVLADGWHFLLPFVVLIGLLFWMNRSPQASALAATATIILLGFIRGYGGIRLSMTGCVQALIDAGRQSVEIVVIVAAAGFVIGVLNATGLVFNLAMVVVDVAAGNLFVLLVMTALVSIVLGMGMPTVAVYVLLAALIVPALITAGVDKMAAHFFVLYFGMMSMITPPIAIAAYAAASLAKESPLGVSVQAMRYAWLAYLIPFVFVFRPEFLIGHPLSNLPGEIEVITATLLVLALMSGVLSGFSNRALRPGERVFFGLVALLVLTACLSSQWQWPVYLIGVFATFLCWRPARLMKPSRVP